MKKNKSFTLNKYNQIVTHDPEEISECLKILKEGNQSDRENSRIARAIEMFEEVNSWDD